MTSIYVRKYLKQFVSYLKSFKKKGEEKKQRVGRERIREEKSSEHIKLKQTLKIVNTGYRV